MDVFERAERLMGMTDELWARHASPWSVATRFTILPLFVLAVWSRVWIGWLAVLVVAGVCVWAWWNPRAFPPPASTDNWAAKGTFGERVFLNRKTVPIPRHHERWGVALGWASASGVPFLFWGLWALEVWPTVLGVVLIVLPKVWFVDRMVWLYEDMKDTTDEYRGWLR